MLNISEIPKKRRANAEHWITIISEHSKSGLSVRKYCQKQKINSSTFYYWFNYLNGKTAAPIGGNFFVIGKCTSLQMPDKTSLSAIVKEHENLFGKGKIKSVGTDKAYYSDKNEKLLAKKGVVEIGIQRPCNIKRKHPKPLSEECQERLVNRRSGIEPLIGHIKQNGQLGRSRMKSDKAIECSGYTSVLGFNMRQIIRYQKGKFEKKVA